MVALVQSIQCTYQSVIVTVNHNNLEIHSTIDQFTVIMFGIILIPQLNALMVNQRKHICCYYRLISIYSHVYIVAMYIRHSSALNGPDCQNQSQSIDTAHLLLFINIQLQHSKLNSFAYYFTTVFILYGFSQRNESEKLSFRNWHSTYSV